VPYTRTEDILRALSIYHTNVSLVFSREYAEIKGKKATNLIIDIGTFQPLCVYIPARHHNVLPGTNLQPEIFDVNPSLLQCSCWQRIAALLKNLMHSSKFCHVYKWR
jgi:hypothetical protein